MSALFNKPVPGESRGDSGDGSGGQSRVGSQRDSRRARPGTHAEPPPSLDTQLRDAQLALVYEQGRSALIAGGAGLLFVGYAFYGVAAREVLAAWLGAGILAYLLRFILVLAYRRASRRPQGVAGGRWDVGYMLGTLATGVLWGAAILLPPPHFSAYHTFLVVCTTALGAGAIVSYAPLKPLPAAFIVPAITPLALFLIVTGTDLQQMMGVVLLIFMAVLLISALVMHEAITRTLRLGLENASLATTLRRAKEDADALNRDLRLEIDERRQAEQRIRVSRRELSRILDNIQDTYFRTDAGGLIVQVSPSVTRLLGYSVNEVIGKNLDNLAADPEVVQDFMQRLAADGGRVHGYEMQLTRKDGGRVWVSKNAQYYYNDYGEIAGVEGTGHDITGLKQAEAALRAEKERALVTLGSIGDGVIATDAAGRVEYMNPVAEQLTGWRAAVAGGRPLADVFHIVDEDTRQLAEDPVRVCLRSRGNYRIPGHPILLSATDAAEYSVEVNVSPIADEDGSLTGAVLVFHDVTELRGLAREMSYQASHDMLTGLVNRREFELRLEAAIQTAVSEGMHHAVCYLDLDQFKVVNDTCGHLAGDEFLRQLAGRLQTRIRESDILARLGGDEFGVLLEGCPLDKAVEIADDLRGVVKAYRFEWEDHSFEMGASVGLVGIDKDSGSLAEVLSAADSACYVAKDLGRNRTHVFSYDDSDLARHHSHMLWVQRLQRALDRDSFVLHCQRADPVKAGADGMRYQEILLRMVEGEELIGPGVFIPAAERYHLMPAIDRWVVRHALQALGRKPGWDERDLFAINLSGQSLGDEAFLDYVSGELAQSGVPAARICFEITETAAVANLRSAQKFISTLKRLGCAFALDDFGSGLSSFAYLKRLPVDFLKIDGRFVRDMATDPVDHAMVESINQLGHVVGVKTIAEFVENAAILEQLERLGVDYAQGYGVHKPAPLEQCTG